MPVPNNTFAAKLCPFLMRYIRNMPMMRFMVGSMLFMKKKKMESFCSGLIATHGCFKVAFDAGSSNAAERVELDALVAEHARIVAEWENLDEGHLDALLGELTGADLILSSSCTNQDVSPGGAPRSCISTTINTPPSTQTAQWSTCKLTLHELTPQGHFRRGDGGS